MSLRRLGFLALLALSACEADTKDSDGGDEGADGGGDGGGSGLDGTDGGDGSGGDGGGDGADGGDGGGGKPDCQEALELSVWLASDVWGVELLTTDAYTNDSGLAALFALIPSSGDTVTEQTLPIVEATVINVGYAPSGGTPNIYLEDAAGALMTFYVETSPDVKPGDKVSMTVTDATNYFGNREITGLTDFTIVSSGNPVHYNVANGTALDVATMSLQNVHVWGELSAELPDCGASCFDLTYGTETVTYRINNEFLEYPDQVGDCVDVLAPLGSYSNAPQLDIGNYDWRWVSY